MNTYSVYVRPILYSGSTKFTEKKSYINARVAQCHPVSTVETSTNPESLQIYCEIKECFDWLVIAIEKEGYSK